jgi:hypothetical protein
MMLIDPFRQRRVVDRKLNKVIIVVEAPAKAEVKAPTPAKTEDDPNRHARAPMLYGPNR